MKEMEDARDSHYKFIIVKHKSNSFKSRYVLFIELNIQIVRIFLSPKKQK